jgi:hypothetical protein
LRIRKELTMRGTRGLLLAMLGLLPLMTGCVLGTRQVTLAYPPERSAEDLGSGAVARSIASPETRQPIVLVPFADRRYEKMVIGEVRGTGRLLGVRTADVVTTNNVAEWVNQAIRVELEEAGYEVTMGEGSGRPGGTPVLSGEIMSVYCTALMLYEARVSFSAQITKDGREILKKLYRGDGSAGTNLAATASSYSRSLSLALAEAAGRLVSDLNSLFFTTLR